jgi:hypothetical protein
VYPLVVSTTNKQTDKNKNKNCGNNVQQARGIEPGLTHDAKVKDRLRKDA